MIYSKSLSPTGLDITISFPVTTTLEDSGDGMPPDPFLLGLDFLDEDDRPLGEARGPPETHGIGKINGSAPADGEPVPEIPWGSAAFTNSKGSGETLEGDCPKGKNLEIGEETFFFFPAESLAELELADAVLGLIPLFLLARPESLLPDPVGILREGEGGS